MMFFGNSDRVVDDIMKDLRRNALYAGPWPQTETRTFIRLSDHYGFDINDFRAITPGDNEGEYHLHLREVKSPMPITADDAKAILDFIFFQPVPKQPS